MFDQPTNYPQTSVQSNQPHRGEVLNRQALSRFVLGRILFDGASQVPWGWLMLCVLAVSTFIPSILRGTRSSLDLFAPTPHILMGLLMVFLYGKSSINTLKLIRHGAMTIGRFQYKHRKRLNKSYVYEYVFKTNINGKIYQPTTKHKIEYDLPDQDEVLIFYNPEDPMDIAVFELIPGNPYFDSRNAIVMDKSWSNIKYFIMPVISILGIPVLLLVEKYLNQTKIRPVSTTPEQDNTIHLLASKERSVSLLTCIRVLFGGLTHELGWVLLAFSLPFFFVFVSPKDIKGLIFQASQKAETVGIVESINQTNNTKNRNRVYAIQFQYEINDRIYRSESYSTSRFTPKQVVNIEYRINNPSDARIEGTGFTSNAFGGWCMMLILLAFPMAGAVLIMRSFKRNIISRDLLASGNSVLGIYKERVATNITIGNKQVYKLIYEFTAHNGNTYMADCTDEAMPKQKDKAVILYNPTTPSQAVIFDGIPGKLIINEQGHIFSPQRWHSIQVLIGPILSIGWFTLIVAMIMQGLR